MSARPAVSSQTHWSRSPDADVRSPISSSCTADPFTGDGATCPGGAIGTPFLLHTSDESPQRLLAHAYEPADVTTGEASAITQTSAHVDASVNPAGAAVRVHLEYGPTPAYGSRTPDQQLGAAGGPVAFGADLAGLPPYATVYYRAVAESEFGTFAGAARVLRTAPVYAPGTGTPGHGDSGSPGHGGKPGKKHRKRHWPRIANQALILRADGTVRVVLTCPATHGPRCVGTLRLTRGKQVVGRRAFALTAGRTEALSVRVTPRARTAARRGKAALKVRVSAGTSAKTLTLRPAKA